MKRFYFIVAFAVALLLIGMFLSRRSKPEIPGKEGIVNSQETATSQVESVKQELGGSQAGETNISPEIRLAIDEQNQKYSKMIGVTPDMTPEQVRQKALDWYRSESAKLVPEQKPIQLFGKVVDEKMQPIGRASVHFIWTDASKSNGTSEADSVSADDGSFSLTRGTGGQISVYVTKEGYYEAKSLNGFDSDVTGHGSSMENPVLFHFRKKGAGADLITSDYGVYRDVRVAAPKDGTVVRLNFFDRKSGDVGQLAIANLKPADGRERSDWSFVLSIPDGGLLEHHDEFPLEAPEAGYQPTIEFKFDKTGTNWVTGIKKDFYIMFGQPRKYGRIHVETDTFTSGARIQYAINPDGSRYLEPK